MTNLDILRSGFCTTHTAEIDSFIKIKFKTPQQTMLAFDALMTLLADAIKAEAIDANIDSPIDIGRGNVNAVHAEPVHDMGCGA